MVFYSFSGRQVVWCRETAVQGEPREERPDQERARGVLDMAGGAHSRMFTVHVLRQFGIGWTEFVVHVPEINSGNAISNSFIIIGISIVRPT